MLKLRSLIKIFFFFLLLSPLLSGAQQLSNYRSKIIILTSDTIIIDTLSIIPKSLVIRDSTGIIIDSSLYKINYPEAKLILKTNDKNVYKILIFSYKVFPFNFSSSFRHKNSKLIEPDAKGNYNPFAYSYEDQKTDIFKFGGLNKNGSISRGVSFGNSQDVVVNSSFNLQLSGKLSDDIEVLAAITDNNVPIQPDGNTQQIQDFDKVFIQLSSKNAKLIAGDFELTKPDSYFMNFNKKAQGGCFSTSFLTSNDKTKKKKGRIDIKGAAAISKGKYAKNIFVGEEGNQGPYKLTGAENETYIIVLSGTEKVYVDGELLMRGQENDYIIDYNTAQVTFTAKRLITKDSRISIEFEYSNQNYARSLFYEGTNYTSDKLKIHFNFYSEQDIKNQPIQQQLTDKQKKLLSQVGDSLNHAVVPYVDSIAFTNDQVLYKKVDSTVASIKYDSVFIYCTNKDSAFYQLGFSNVGANKGNYIQIQSSANGRVFQWIAPVAGVKQGNSEPVIQLIAPKKNQMVSLATEYAISKRTKASVELAMSNNDINTFSTIDKSHDIGYAVKADVKNTLPIGKKDSANWRLITEVSNEYNDKYFAPIERYRNVEFERDWNITQLLSNTDQDISSFKLSLADKKGQFTSYQIRSFVEGSQYSGLQNILNGDLTKKGFHLLFNGSLVTTDDKINTSSFLRSTADLSKKFKWLVIGVQEDQEHNTFFKVNTDSLQKNSFSYHEVGGYICNPDTAKNKYKIFYKNRQDFLPHNNSLQASTTAQDIGISLELLKKINNRLSITGTYRTLEIKDTAITQQKEDKSLLGRLEYNLKALKGVISSNTFYEIGSGLEVKQEFSYLEVSQGQGVYTWTDYNGDGIKQLNEFEIAAFPDQANYIRVYTPTNQYVKTYTDQFSEALTLNPAAVWSSKKGFKKFISRLSDQTTYRIDNKNTDKDITKAYNPFVAEVNDTSLISVNSSFRNAFYFNRSSSKFGFDLDYQQNSNKSMLVDGFDSRVLISKFANVKWNISRKFSITSKYEFGKKTSKSDYFSINDYNIHYSETAPTFSFQPNASFRISFNYKYTDKRNEMGAIGEKAFLNNTGIDIKYNVLSKGSLLLRASYIKIKYNSDESTPIAYEMLEGLKSGNNATWSLSYQRNLSGNLQLTLNYEGRQSQGVKIVHVGSMQIRAYF